MITNTKVTIYHRGVSNHLPTYTKYVVSKAMWQGGHGSALNKGIADSNDITCYIPLENDNLKNVSIAIGDYILRGEITSNITSKSDLENQDVYTIQTIIYEDYGSDRMQHFKIGAK